MLSIFTTTPGNRAIFLTNSVWVQQTQQIDYSLNSSFIDAQIDECNQRGIWFVVTFKCAIYRLIEITWLS